jgi:methionyl-tRNA formyltransferase
MNIIFFGSTDYSVRILERLVCIGQSPVLTVTQPDKPKGRGLNSLPTAVKKAALERGLKVVTPRDLASKKVQVLLSQFKPEIFLVVSYGNILPEDVLKIPSLMAVGVHPSLLPLYRGAAPVNWALIKGEKKTGVSLYKMDTNMDAGPVFLQETVSISETDDYLSLWPKLYRASEKILEKGLQRIKTNQISLEAQDQSKATYAPKINKQTAKIDWSNTADNIANLVRGLSGYKPAWSWFSNRRIKIIKAIPEEQYAGIQADFGEVIFVDKQRLKVQSGEGIINITELQPEAKKAMTAESFINGYRPQIGCKFS